ncbi:hypothetical protein BC834DRAFT_55811 [Gloeopeniophorella convolvens]|nr:hypothetical protein BC834DRAFT_55811 [Gloeopeniophorella convolvens]
MTSAQVLFSGVLRFPWTLPLAPALCLPTRRAIPISISIFIPLGRRGSTFTPPLEFFTGPPCPFIVYFCPQVSGRRAGWPPRRCPSHSDVLRSCRRYTF